MTDTAPPDAYGTLIEPTTLSIQRLLPGPIERVWAFLTQSDLRRRWLASGDMELKVGAPFTMVWRNDELTDPPGARPEGFGAEHSMESRITECDPPRKLTFVWGAGDVAIALEERGGKVLLTLTHRRIAERSSRVMIGAGWHAHLDILAARVAGKEPATPFWDGWLKLRQEYDRRLPA
jgi:uncharacterized protein YndB with AHSA1/START domain